MTETAEIYGGIRAKIAAVRAAEDANYREYCDLKEKRSELQNECTHTEDGKDMFRPSKRFGGVEFCEICGSVRMGARR